MQHLQKLAFIFMQALALYVENGVLIEPNALLFIYIFREALFIIELDLLKAAQEGIVIIDLF